MVRLEEPKSEARRLERCRVLWDVMFPSHHLESLGSTVRPMSHLRQSRATLTHDKGSRVKVASVTGHIARCVMARRTVARLVFGIERCSILCDFDARQSRTSLTRDKIAGVTSLLSRVFDARL